MNIRILTLTSLFCCSAGLAMQEKKKPQIPPSKEGVAAFVNFVAKKCGLQEMDTDETQNILAAFAELTNNPAHTIHELVQQAQVQRLALRAAEREYHIDLELLEAMQANNTAKIRALLERCQNRESIKDVAKKFLDEEIKANQEIVDQKSK